MRRASFITKHRSCSLSEDDDLDENGNVEDGPIQPVSATLQIPMGQNGLAPSRSFSNFWSKSSNAMSQQGMSSRPSFISLMLIASDDELSRLPRLPAPLQVETDTYQKCGWGDEPKKCSHLPILNPPSDSDEEQDGIIQTIIHLPERMRKISADKQRFNVYALPDEDREQLKNLYVF